MCNSSATVYKVTVTQTGLQTQQVGGCSGAFFSIAVDNNKFYYNDGSNLYRADLIDAGTGAPTLANCTYMNTQTYGNALTVDKDGKIYYVSGTELFAVNPVTGISNSLGIMQYAPSGDLLFYNNELYMASYGGIVKIPLDDPSKAEMWVQIENESIYGLATAAVNSNIKAYAFTGSGFSTNVLELDLKNRLLKGSAGTLPFTVYDAGSAVESGIEPPLEILDVKVSRSCDVINRAMAEIVTKAHASEYIYTLNNGLSNATGTFDNLAPGTYQVTVKADNGQAPVSRTFIVPDYSKDVPIINATVINPVCDLKGSVKLQVAVSGYKIKVNNSIYENGHQFNNLLPGNYDFNIITTAGCIIAEKSYTLTQEVCPPITIKAINIAADCDNYGAGTVTVLTEPHPDNYTYTLGGTSNTSGVFANLLPGSYNLVIQSAGGDNYQQQVIVPDFKPIIKPALSVIINNAVCTAAGKVKFVPNGDIKDAAKILFQNNVYKIGQQISDLAVGPHHFTILSEQDCVLDEIDVSIDQDECNPVDFPNTFTPNGDGMNDVFRPNQDSNPVKYTLTVFNRNGQQIFQTKSTSNGWDGNYKGSIAPAGVYYWVCTYIMGDATITTKKGWVTLIR
ncbi:gliding motility-associated C-terminal domain-containing protein [Mucilaginibacter litoreus]|uniref:Gliding motility-associated C-terminal domain-containing protein n=1 Tax=Mucilaginibacter litoreus TaxID=1048221 RepID=A0ABW3APM3_9SPHI